MHFAGRGCKVHRLQNPPERRAAKALGPRGVLLATLSQNAGSEPREACFREQTQGAAPPPKALPVQGGRQPLSHPSCPGLKGVRFFSGIDQQKRVDTSARASSHCKTRAGGWVAKLGPLVYPAGPPRGKSGINGHSWGEVPTTEVWGPL